MIVVKDRNTSGGAIVKQVDYAYDAFNRLVKRTYDADGSGAGAATSQYWVYDEGINAVLQFDGSASTNLSHRYLWTGVVDELIADESVGSGADTLYALSDHLGTIRDIANYNESTSATTVTNHRTYNSFGKLTAETNAAVDLIFGYTGKQLDDATGLQHSLFRWYDSSLGQWLSEDPLGFAAGDENLKRYVGNGVLNRLDTKGLYSTELSISLAMQQATQQDQNKKEGEELVKDLAKKIADVFRDKLIETPLVQDQLETLKKYRQCWDEKIHFPWESDPTKSFGPGPWHPNFLKPSVPWWKRVKPRFQYHTEDWLSPLVPKSGGVSVEWDF